jgi:serine/threonine-protein kinase HipA
MWPLFNYLYLSKKTLVIKKVDLVSAFNTSKLDEKQANIFKKMVKSKPIWMDQIDNSFLNNEFKAAYKLLFEERFSRIFAFEE